MRDECFFSLYDLTVMSAVHPMSQCMSLQSMTLQAIFTECIPGRGKASKKSVQKYSLTTFTVFCKFVSVFGLSYTTEIRFTRSQQILWYSSNGSGDFMMQTYKMIPETDAEMKLMIVEWAENTTTVFPIIIQITN